MPSLGYRLLLRFDLEHGQGEGYMIGKAADGAPPRDLGPGAGGLAITVIIITAFRVNSLKTCLGILAPQLKTGDEVLAVTGSGLPEEHALMQEFQVLRVIESDRLCMPYQRNLGILEAHNDILAFIDDDVQVGEKWRQSVSELYSDASVDAVVGREILEGYESEVRDDVPRLTWRGIRGSMQHYTGQTVCEVRGGQGCNMSFRRSVLERIDGFDPNYIVKAYGEESDVFERLHGIGARVLFHPGMDVLHCPAEAHEYGRGAFNLRGAYYLYRNYAYLYSKFFFFGPQYCFHVFGATWGYFIKSARRVVTVTVHTAAAFGLSIAGTISGTYEGIRWRLNGRKHKHGGLSSLAGMASTDVKPEVRHGDT
jgi:GT2 family glycosyltransferase